MFRLPITTKSLSSVSKNIFRASSLKTASSLYPKKVCFFSTSQVPNKYSDQFDKENDRSVKEFVSMELTYSGGRLSGLLCVVGGLVHLNLNLAVLAISGLIAGVGGIEHLASNRNSINWPQIACISLLSACMWKANISSNFKDLEAATMVLTFFPSISLLSATVFGASSLYVKYASQVSQYHPAIIGTLAGMGLIAAETCIPGNTSVLGHLYTPEQLSDIYSYMSNTLPFLTIATTFRTSVAIKTHDVQNCSPQGVNSTGISNDKLPVDNQHFLVEEDHGKVGGTTIISQGKSLPVNDTFAHGDDTVIDGKSSGCVVVQEGKVTVIDGKSSGCVEGKVTVIDGKSSGCVVVQEGKDMDKDLGKA